MGGLIEPDNKKQEYKKKINNMDNQNKKKKMNMDNQKEKKKMKIDNQKENKKMKIDISKERKKMNKIMEKKNMNMDNPMGMINMNMDNPMGMMNMNIGNPMGMMNMNIGNPMGMMNMNMGNPMGMMNMNMGNPMEITSMNMGYPEGMLNMNMNNQMKKKNMNNQMGMRDVNNLIGIDDKNLGNQMKTDDDLHKIQNILKNHGFEIIKYIEKTKNGNLFLISDILNKNKKNMYFLHKIEFKSKEEKKKIEKEIDIVKKINSKYLMKIIEHFFFSEKEKDNVLIILNYYENNLTKIIHQSNFLNSRNVWKIFIQIILGLNSLILENMLPLDLIPQNIYIDNENNIKIGGINNILDFSDEKKEDENINDKTNIFSLGSILYELIFKKPFKNLVLIFLKIVKKISKIFYLNYYVMKKIE
jgi:hypothetical protein